MTTFIRTFIPWGAWRAGLTLAEDEFDMTPLPETPPPIICPEVHNTRPVDPDECMAAVRLLSKGNA
jgi:hypothetical protein